MKLYTIKDNEGWRSDYWDNNLTNAKKRAKERLGQGIFSSVELFYIIELNTKTGREQIVMEIKRGAV